MLEDVRGGCTGGGFVWKGNKELHHYESGTTNASSKTKTAINYSTGTE